MNKDTYGVSKQLDIIILDANGDVMDHWRKETTSTISSDELMQLRYNVDARDKWLFDQMSSPNPVVRGMAKTEFAIDRILRGIKRHIIVIKYKMYEVLSIQNLVTGGVMVVCLFIGYNYNSTPTQFDRGMLYHSDRMTEASMEDNLLPSPAEKNESVATKAVKKKQALKALPPAVTDDSGIVDLLPARPASQRSGVALPRFRLIQFDNGTTVPLKNSEEGIAYRKAFSLNRAEFTLYLKALHKQFKKYESEYHINALVETARHSIEAWEEFKDGNFYPSPLFVGTGNGGGNKCFDKSNPSYVCMVDDKKNADVNGRNRFYNFNRTEFFDTEAWVKYQATVQMQSDYYKIAREVSDNEQLYAFSQGNYSTTDGYCAMLYKRTLSIQKLIQ